MVSVTILYDGVRRSFFFGETIKTREEISTTFKEPSAVFACPAEPTMLLPGLLGLMLLRSERQNFADILVENDERTTKNSAASQAYSSLRNTANSHRFAFNFLDSEERMFLVAYIVPSPMCIISFSEDIVSFPRTIMRSE